MYRYPDRINNKFLLALGSLLICAVCLQAQKPETRHRNKYSIYAQQIERRYSDTLSMTFTRDTSYIQSDDTPEDPYFYPILLTPTLYDSPLEYVMGNSWKPLRIIPDKVLFKSDCIRSSVPMDSIRKIVSTSMAWAYTFCPWLITNTQDNIDKTASLRKDIMKEPVKDITHITSPDDNIETGIEDASYKVVTHKPNFWTFSGSTNFNMSQTYASDNWFQGNQRSNTYRLATDMRLNYDNQRGLKYENRLQARLGFINNHNDKKHKYLTNDDKLEIWSNIGVSAVKHWYYTIQLNAWTQMYPKYASNSDYVNSDFLSPVEGNLSVGMYYEIKFKRFSFKLNLLPLSYHAKYVDRKALRHNYGIRGEHHSYNDIGYNVTSSYEWKIANNITTKGNLYFYSNTHYAQAWLESTTTFSINRYLNTSLYLYPRFDDTHYKNGKKEFWQFYENLGIGFGFNF